MRDLKYEMLKDEILEAEETDVYLQAAHGQMYVCTGLY